MFLLAHKINHYLGFHFKRNIKKHSIMSETCPLRQSYTVAHSVVDSVTMYSYEPIGYHLYRSVNGGETVELWDIYDRDRINTGKIMERGKIPDGIYHLVVHICLFNSNNEMLIQQRQPFKEGWSNMWDITVGGSAIAGETSQIAAERELSEEIGHKIDFSSIRPHFSINFDVGFDDYYLIEENIDIEKLNLQYDEVQRVKWATKDEIFCLLNNGEFVPYYRSLIELIFETRYKYGALVV